MVSDFRARLESGENFDSILADLEYGVEEELEAALANLPPQTLQIGFYSYGEISPTGGYCDLHNQTMTITTLSEKPSGTPVG